MDKLQQSMQPLVLLTLVAVLAKENNVKSKPMAN